MSEHGVCFLVRRKDTLRKSGCQGGNAVFFTTKEKKLWEQPPLPQPHFRKRKQLLPQIFQRSADVIYHFINNYKAVVEVGGFADFNRFVLCIVLIDI